ncbi:hypothetical protein L210DRAFT_987352 [Boletus edulis BED1]|uniref:Uncharacterized protein n=1 Tax=Boletus edulis BED1 TaxID=1328754 RepID=A0AAD4C7E9_BOLED|nr:hypothetical protein L210DRAFT_987352 [Boletus edulis BED1]
MFRTAYLAGYLGTAYIPGHISETEPVFAASIPNLAVVSAGFALLAALIVLAHFRPSKGVQFTLVNVAAADMDQSFRKKTCRWFPSATYELRMGPF